MPGKVTPPSIPVLTKTPSETTESNTQGNRKGKEVSISSPPADSTFRKDSDTDSGIGSDIGTPLSERAISLGSGHNSTPDSPDVFRFDEPAIRAAMLNDSARLAPGKLGAGGHGSVYKVIVKDESGSEHYLALKVTKSSQSSDREKGIMESIGTHPNIVRYYGEAEIGEKKGLLFEYLSGSSLERMYSELLSTPMSAEERMNAIKFLEQQKLEAAAHTGESGIIHADQKPSNYLCDPKTGMVKLIDFGEAIKAGEKSDPGHEEYAAPETLKSMGSRASGPEAATSMDSYAMGQMLYRQITAKEGELGAPYMFGLHFNDIKTHQERHIKIFRTVMAMRPILKAEEAGENIQVLDTSSDSITDRAYQIAKNSLSPQSDDVSDKEIEEKAQASARMLEPEILLVSSLINGLMHINPDKRISASEALKHPWFQVNSTDREQALQTLSKLDL